ncbi:MAG: hypothetical protein K9H64_02110 [Bacteroidales bacterium]|nr:hypothetical protein [Bacteroidales bacterium]MCF8454659.1 hypothetical protein [Bacteroidales bacterium]
MRITITLLIGFLIANIPLIGQIIDSDINHCIPETDTPQGKQVYRITENMPEYPGGEIELRKFITKNIVYSKNDSYIQSKAFFTFVIDTTGKVVNGCILRPLFKDKLTSVEQSVLSVIESLPDWKPGEQSGEKVPVRFIAPINIQWGD